MALDMRPLEDIPPEPSCTEAPPAGQVCFGSKIRNLAAMVRVGARVPPSFAVQSTGIPPGRWPADEIALFKQLCQGLRGSGKLVLRPSVPGTLHSPAHLLPPFKGLRDSSDAMEAADLLFRRFSTVNKGSHPPPALLVQREIRVGLRGSCYTRDPHGEDPGMLIVAARTRTDGTPGAQETWRVYRSGQKRWEYRLLGQDEGPRLLSWQQLLNLSELTAFFHSRLASDTHLQMEWVMDPQGWIHWLQCLELDIHPPQEEFKVEHAFQQVVDGPVTLWTNLGLGQTLPSPLAPLTWSVWRNAIAPVVLAPLVAPARDSVLAPHTNFLDRVQGRVYWNVNGILLLPFARRALLNFLNRTSPEAARAVAALIKNAVIQPRHLPGGRWRILVPVLRAYAGNLSGLATALRPALLLSRMERFKRAMAKRSTRSLAFMSGQDLLLEIGQTPDAEQASLKGLAHANLLGEFFHRRAMKAFRFAPLAQSLLGAGSPGSPVTQMTLDLEDLAVAARPLAPVFLNEADNQKILERLARKPAGMAWLAAWRRFIRDHGHRRLGETDLGQPRWAENPSQVFALLRNLLKTQHRTRLSLRLKRLAARRAEALEEAIASKPAPWRPWLRFLEKAVQKYQPFWEMAQNYFMLAFHRVRLAALELGKRLQDQGCIDEPSDVFLLEYDELTAIVQDQDPSPDKRSLVRQRKALMARFASRSAPMLIRSDGIPVTFQERSSRGSTVLEGIGVSSGRVQGVLRFLREPAPILLGPQDILVINTADASLAPLFSQAIGLVARVGGFLNPAAVVAREMGLPAVFGVEAIFEQLEEGRQVTIDGDAGTVQAPGAE